MTKRKQLNVTVDEEILISVRARLQSPLYSRTMRGSMQLLIEELLTRWLKETQPK